MANGQKDIMAQAVYLAQLEASKGKCNCKACKILRKATSRMTAEFLQEAPANPGSQSLVDAGLVNPGEE